MISFFKKRQVGPFFRSASVCEYNGFTYLNPYARTRDGVRTGMAIVERVEIGQPVEIGEKLLRILDQCLDNIPDDYTRGPSPAVAALIQASGAKSWQIFHRENRELSVFQQRKGDLIQIAPLRKMGSGSERIDNKIIEIEPLPDVVGHAVLSALAECE